ncbi:Kinesin-like protein kifc1 [Podochytrium sp. JEL0797]|nr:Kinesin-like protein kifc1 [Podochytrium sp. JEL0797]
MSSLRAPSKLKAPSTAASLRRPSAATAAAAPAAEDEFVVHHTTTTATSAAGTKRKAASSSATTSSLAATRKASSAASSASISRRPPSTTPSLTTRSSSATSTTRSSTTTTNATTRKPAAATTEDASQPPPKKKRAAWDVKGRLEDVEEFSKMQKKALLDSTTHIEDLSGKLGESQEQIKQLFDFKQSLESKVHIKEQENGEISGRLQSLMDELEASKEAHKSQVTTLTEQHAAESKQSEAREAALAASLASLQSDFDRVNTENASLKASLAIQSTSLLTFDSDLRASKLHTASLESQLSTHLTRIASLESTISQRDVTVLELEDKLRQEESVRRKLHNTVQELKGNIRVFCRIRPPVLESEAAAESLTHIKFSETDDKSLELMQLSESASGQNTVVKTYPFSFDKVFQPSTPQPAIFSELSQLVQSSLDGYNVCLFAYGQTGSGKTYTMEGTPSNPGMIPLAVAQIFETTQTLKAKGWGYTFEAQFLEIYNETVRDLLGNGGGGKHDIRHVGDKTVVTDVTVVPVTTGKQVHDLLKKAQTNRAVAATNSNEHSSRSHSVFTLRLSGVNELTLEKCEGVLNLIDLAGSERLTASGSVGDRLKETQAINKSLSSLGDVIYALGNKEAHVPYRNSKLTYLLQNSLGGNSKTLMFVNVSPMVASFGESLCSLRFATKVNSCQIGTAKAVRKG